MQLLRVNTHTRTVEAFFTIASIVSKINYDGAKIRTQLRALLAAPLIGLSHWYEPVRLCPRPIGALGNRYVLNVR